MIVSHIDVDESFYAFNDTLSLHQGFFLRYFKYGNRKKLLQLKKCIEGYIVTRIVTNAYHKNRRFPGGLSTLQHQLTSSNQKSMI
jgi:hypothetical protein